MRARPGARVAARRSLNRGSSRKNASAATPTSAGHQTEQRVAWTGQDPDPQAESGQDQRDHVDRAGQQEQHRRALGDPSWVAAALHQQPRADRDAAGATERDRRAERELAERDPRPEANRRSFEHLQEGQHVAQAGEDLEHDREHEPAAAHLADRVGHAVQPGDREQQADDDRDQDPERDQAAPQAPARLDDGVGEAVIADARIRLPGPGLVDDRGHG